TARAGSRASQQELSEERAASVGQYLVELGVRDQYHVFTEGVGSDKPVADNGTEAGRARNRRVEITILEK
ncbi:MAG: OmpA family protein, partial [Spirochaetaceae bacterium]|nr:OmpA family protein [Spirochaetaceae bacterium]